MKTEILIVGSGIIGLYTAYALLESANKITLIDKNLPGQESTWAAGGILSPLLPWEYDTKIFELTKQANQHYSALAETLLNFTGIDTEFWRCGLSLLDENEYPTAKTWCDQNDFEIRTDHKNRMYLPSIAQIRSPRVVKALTKYLQSKGVQFISNCTLLNIKQVKQRITAVQTSQGELKTEVLVCAAGAWSQNILRSNELDLNFEVFPVQGQMIAFDGSSIQLDTVLYSQGHYLIPRQDGLILAGSTLENIGFDKSITDAARQELLHRSINMLPELQTCPIVHQWSGLRPGTKNNLPIVGQHENIHGLYFNCGHHRYGITMAPACANLLVEQIHSA